MIDWREMIDEFIDTRAEHWREVRRHLHANPELSRDEFQTTAYLAQCLRDAGITYQTVPSRRGLIAEPEDQADRPRVAIRADIDALGMHDGKTVPYRSRRDGVLHACGHDAHATMVLAAAAALWHARDVLPAETAWRAIFQPAEEVGEGAHEMVAAGAVEQVRALVALHVDPELLVGRIGHRSGAFTAHCQELHVTFAGKGGHAARPHSTVDPIAAAAQFITNTYQLVPRWVDSREPVVVSFGSIKGGASPNVIPEQVDLLGTIRTLDAHVAAIVLEQVRQVARGVSEATRVQIEVEVRQSTAAVHNDPRVSSVCVCAAGEVVGPANLQPIPLPSMGGEDFSGYLCMRQVACSGWVWRRQIEPGRRCIPRGLISMSAPSRSVPRCWRIAWSSCPT